MDLSNMGPAKYNDFVKTGRRKIFSSLLLGTLGIILLVSYGISHNNMYILGLVVIAGAYTLWDSYKIYNSDTLSAIEGETTLL